MKRNSDQQGTLNARNI